jgi:hypothetical protein
MSMLDTLGRTLGNRGDGIHIVRSPGNTIGGATGAGSEGAAPGNVIAGSFGDSPPGQNQPVVGG